VNNPPMQSSASQLTLNEAESALRRLAHGLDASSPRAPISTEARLSQLEARYHTLVEGIPAVTFMASLDEDCGERELYVSPQIESLLGFTQKEWLEDPILWHSQLHPDDRERWHEEFARTCAVGEPFHSVYRFLSRQGRVVWVRGEAKLVRDAAGRPLFLQGVAFDITAIKEAEEELKAMNQLLEQRVAERTDELVRSNASLERFGYVIAHDLRAPLRTIKSYTQKLPAEVLTQLDPLAGEHLTRIIHAADRMRVQIDDLLVYSRVRSQGKELTPTDCAAALAAACANVQADLDDSGGIVTAEALPTVLADKTQLVQLFQNLLSNALKFRAESTPHIHVSACREGDVWRLSLADNGIGIESQYLERIFGLGERLHSIAKYPGNGIGLATCEKIVQRHGGRIWADSEGPERGSTFHFTMPAL
jgi:PAS domain S-box-containing protein